ncbi:hypothetical protein BJY04DRAFT_226905 [Aspergillus karnatakaensis]|uniref:DUF3425 domain-containing protein n=1 Tax=Aspergillus karnatakaensis TaxID=1810916 RepID=UPI003CCE44E0
MPDTSRKLASATPQSCLPLAMPTSAKSPILHRVFPGVQVTAEDDWFGVTDPKTRRTPQNRLNQRSRRERRRAIKSQKSQQLRPSTSNSNSNPLEMLDRVRILGPTAQGSGQVLRQLESLVISHSHAHAHLHAHATRLHGSPLNDLRLSVTRLSVLRALHSNLLLLGYSPLAVHDDAQSRFTVTSPAAVQTVPEDILLLPPDLQPTIIQTLVPHHPWLDLIPFPAMRDALILAQDWIDDEQLCHDMCGQGQGDSSSLIRKGLGETGMLVWRDPWDPSGWEVTERFVRSWGWTLSGCLELFESSNSWRARRGEGPLTYLS